MLSLLREGFFKTGETWADLKCEGKEPSVSDKFILEVIGVIKISMQSFTRLAGHWIISLARSVAFTVVCTDDARYQELALPPLHTLRLSIFCYAFFDELTLSAFSHQEFVYTVTNNLNALLVLQNYSSLQLWQPVEKLRNETSKYLVLPDWGSGRKTQWII